MSNFYQNIFSNSSNPALTLELLQLLTNSNDSEENNNNNTLHASMDERVSIRRLPPIMPKPTNTPLPSHASIKSNTTQHNNKPMDLDETSLKRLRNTDAARRSRLKKLKRMEQLEKQVNDLESDQSELTTRIAVLETEKNMLHTQDLENQQRIRILEDQLARVHKVLTKEDIT